MMTYMYQYVSVPGGAVLHKYQSVSVRYKQTSQRSREVGDGARHIWVLYVATSAFSETSHSQNSLIDSPVV